MGKKNIPFIFAAHRVPFVATASVGFPEDLIAKINYGKTVKGFKMIIIQSPCPVGWRFDPSKTIEIARLSVQSGVWPLYEIIDGDKLRLTYKPRELKPVAEYMKPQARFRHVTDEQIAGIQEDVARHWEKLLKSDETGQLFL
jgi:pyruvate/2-oxoacid:ferredoxin oxidoreductase beta subunit